MEINYNYDTKEKAATIQEGKFLILEAGSFKILRYIAKLNDEYIAIDLSDGEVVYRAASLQVLEQLYLTGHNRVYIATDPTLNIDSAVRIY
jgi:hypothetical protein